MDCKLLLELKNPFAECKEILVCGTQQGIAKKESSGTSKKPKLYSVGCDGHDNG